MSVQIYDQLPPMAVLTKARTVFSENLLRVPSYELIGPLLDKMRRELPLIPWDQKDRVTDRLTDLFTTSLPSDFSDFSPFFEPLKVI